MSYQSGDETLTHVFEGNESVFNPGRAVAHRGVRVTVRTPIIARMIGLDQTHEALERSGEARRRARVIVDGGTA